MDFGLPLLCTHLGSRFIKKLTLKMFAEGHMNVKIVSSWIYMLFHVIIIVLRPCGAESEPLKVERRLQVFQIRQFHQPRYW